MDSSTSTDSNKKVNFEDLCKEDLIKKCYHLLALAQKAKQSKNSLQEENNKLKEELNKAFATNGATEELINKLTHQKLSLVTSVEELKSHNEFLSRKLKSYDSDLINCQNKLTTCDNKIESYQRQINRLTDENEQLLNNLDSLEKQIEELNKIGIEQRHQLLQLEKHSQDSINSSEENKTIQLQNMLSVSLEEIKQLKKENNAYITKIENLQIMISEKDKHILLISEELMAKNKQLDQISQQLKELNSCDKITEKYVHNNELNVKLEESNNRLKEKIKLYHSKIIKFASIAKNLREDKNVLLNFFKSYMEQVTIWKKQLYSAEQRITEYLDVLRKDNQLLVNQLSEVQSDLKLLQEEKISSETELNNKLHSCEERLKENMTNEVQLKTKLGDFEQLLQLCRTENETLKLDKMLMFSQIENHDINECKTQMQLLKEEKELINTEINKFKSAENDFIKQVEDYKSELEQSHLEKESIFIELQDLKNLIKQYEEQLKYIKEEKNILVESKNELNREVNLLKQENTNFSHLFQDTNEKYDKHLNEYQKKLSEYEDIMKDLKNEIKSYEELGNKCSEEIKKLATENRELSLANESLESRLRELQLRNTNHNNSYCQTDDLLDLDNANDQEQQLLDLKRENSELLSEMNEMNQAIKERGEIISKLEAHLDEVLKKLQIYETQANRNIDNISEKEKIIQDLTKQIETFQRNKNVNDNDEISNLKEEIEVLKEKLNATLDSSYTENDNMSTSTISKTEETNRIKDLEGSWEERYGKLRNLAVKLKGKIRELTTSLNVQQNENEELQKKLSSNIKTIQNLQSQSDKLEDELDKSKKESKQYLNRLNSIATDIVKDKKELVYKDDIISQLKQEIESLKNEKQATEKWKKQISAKVQTLRKEVEANAVLKKDFESRISKLNSDLEIKEQSLKTEIDNHKQTKGLLDQLNNECKKNSVLSLEMQDYERSVKETSKKLEKQQEQILKLNSHFESQKNTIEALREQKKVLEERMNEEEQKVVSFTSEIDTYKLKIGNLEEEIQQKDIKIQNLMQFSEMSRSENEELSMELSKVISEHQKANLSLKNERDHLRSKNLGLQQNLREVQDALKLQSEELKIIHNDYESYKIRAQSVLRQNNNRDVGLEEKLSEEINSLSTQNLNLTTQLNENENKLKTLEATLEDMSYENTSYQKQIKDLEEEIADLRNQYTQLATNHDKTVVENAETIRSLKVHAETLSQCYRQRISEQEARHGQEIIELKSRLQQVPTPTEIMPIPLTMPREEGEGSESIDSNNHSNTQQPIPLERLLGSDSDLNVDKLRKQLSDQESKVVHLTALLSETEKDLIKHIQMNNLLKEEIRRQQRSEEREKHAENLEYLKNVVFKFVTLGSGDERSRLVPVLNTILKLSPEESKQLSVVAKGESSLKVWTNYLPTWSSPSKPQ